jgi:hypothetical protein
MPPSEVESLSHGIGPSKQGSVTTDSYDTRLFNLKNLIKSFARISWQLIRSGPHLRSVTLVNLTIPGIHLDLKSHL